MSVDTLVATVARVINPTPEVAVIDLVPPQGMSFPAFTPGAHIDLHLPYGLVRSYSLINPPSEACVYRLGVLHNPRGRGGSAFIHGHLRAGAQVRISAPRNQFPLLPTAGKAVLIAGGIGITPLLSMARHLKEQGTPCELHYYTRTGRAAPFVSELAELGCPVNHYPGDAPQPRPQISELLARHGTGTHFYCCGPSSMLAAFVQACATQGIDTGYIERFAADLAPASHASQGHDIVLARSGQRLFHSGTGSLLDTLIAAGLKPAYSCREGVCGACETQVLEGELEHRDSVLSDAERQRGRSMMICVSGCKGSTLVLDL